MPCSENLSDQNNFLSHSNNKKDKLSTAELSLVLLKHLINAEGAYSKMQHVPHRLDMVVVSSQSASIIIIPAAQVLPAG